MNAFIPTAEMTFSQGTEILGSDIVRVSMCASKLVILGGFSDQTPSHPLIPCRKERISSTLDRLARSQGM